MQMGVLLTWIMVQSTAIVMEHLLFNIATNNHCLVKFRLSNVKMKMADEFSLSRPPELSI